MNELIEAVNSFDHSVLLFFQENIRLEFLTPVMRGISATVNLGLIWIILSGVLLCFKKTRMIGVVSLSALMLGLLLNNILVKNIVDRVRPFDNYSDLIPLIKRPHGSSFASGHTTASFAAAGVFARFFNKPLTAAVITYAALVGVSRMYLGVHYPTDVLGGVIIGVFSGILAYKIYEKRFDLGSYKLKKHEE